MLDRVPARGVGSHMAARRAAVTARFGLTAAVALVALVARRSARTRVRVARSTRLATPRSYGKLAMMMMSEKLSYYVVSYCAVISFAHYNKNEMNNS